ncbi:MAG: alpha/beta fold hydrolase [Steroidobacteraceae bacterium]|nr:alpha/beta fold hydrolase [Steroidobacteraceae bacterium]
MVSSSDTDPSTLPRRGYVNLAHGQLHYRVAGSGPPVVLLHDSPRSSAMHVGLMQSLADEFTTIALDTPGYGNSSPLPSEPQPEIADFARVLGEALDALGLPRCPVYGFHTSSKITLQLAVERPDRVASAILEGLSLPPGPPDPAFVARYMLPFEPTADGGYLVAQWTKVRDLHRFFPWFRHETAARLPLDQPDDRALHRYGLDVFLAGPHWSSAYSAAMRYAALPAVARLATPTVFMARADDVLFPYLEALPQPLPAGCRIERLPADVDAWRGRLRTLFREFATDAAAALALPDPLAGASDEPRYGYVERAAGQVRVRRYGRGPGRPALLLHETPGGASAVAALATALATDRTVYVPDLPGTGESDPLAAPDVDAYVDVLRDVADTLGLAQFDLVAEFTSVPLAIELARQWPDRVAHVVLDGAWLLTAAERRELWRQYCPRLAPRADGAHLVALWQRLRDQELSWPWYDGRRAAIRTREPQFDAWHLHGQLLDAMRQLEHYGDAAIAAFDYPVKERLEEVHVPVLLLRADGDPRYQWTDKVARKLDAARVLPRPADAVARAQACRTFLDAD